MAVQSQDRKTDAVAVSVKGLGKTFGDKVAFADVSFDFGHGEAFGFLGPNGAGKTTIVRTLGHRSRRHPDRRPSPGCRSPRRTARRSGTRSRSSPSHPACTSG